MPSGGARRGAGRRPSITDPWLIATIIHEFADEWSRLACGNARDRLDHHRIAQELLKDEKRHGIVPENRAKIIGNRARLRAAPIKRPWQLRQSIITSLAKKHQVSERQVAKCLALMRMKAL